MKRILVVFVPDIEKNGNRKMNCVFHAIKMECYANHTVFLGENNSKLTVKNDDIVSISYYGS